MEKTLKNFKSTNYHNVPMSKLVSTPLLSLVAIVVFILVLEKRKTITKDLKH